MDQLSKKDLKPGMAVVNIISDTIGTVRADPNDPQKIMAAPKRFVAVSYNNSTLVGDYHIDKDRHTLWRLKNIRPYNP